jgi:hypothetical protein
MDWEGPVVNGIEEGERLMNLLASAQTEARRGREALQEIMQLLGDRKLSGAPIRKVLDILAAAGITYRERVDDPR